MNLKTKKKSLVKGILLATAVFSMSACSIFDRSEKRVDAGVTYVSNVDSLKDGSYYVYNGKDYGLLYLGDRTFNNSNNSVSMGIKGNTDRVVWLQDDYNNIPTMKRGDKIVYHSSSKLVNTFTVERFYDLGWSIGVGKLKADKNGRYSLPMREKSLSIDPTSDAQALQKITTSEELIIDSIGKTPLRAGNISTAGTILGLEKDKTYAINAYLGTNLHKTNVKADVRILASAEGDRITDFEFSESKTIEFEFPNYYNSGYYMINGFGLVRYIADNSIDNIDKIDMNVPNVYPKDGEEGQDVSQKNFDAEDLVSENIKIESDGNQTITITYSDSTDENTSPPTAKLITPDGASTFKEGDANTLVLSTTVDSGEYEIQIIGLRGRTYSYRVDSGKKNTSEKEEVTEQPEENVEENSTSSTSSSSDKSLADIVNGN